MARIRSPQSSNPKIAVQPLVEQLIAALQRVELADGPVIFEIAQGESGYFQVVIVWEQWADLPTGVRDQIVQEAYHRADIINAGDEAVANNISLILAVTPDQAVGHRLLPYAVQCNVRKSQPNYQQLLPLLKQEGAIETKAGTELRLPTLEMARAARDRLKEATKDLQPEVHWQVADQVGQFFDYN